MSRADRAVTSGKSKTLQNDRIDRKTARHVFFRLGKYLMHYWWLTLAAVLMTLLSNQLALMGPKYSGSAIDAISGAGGVNFPLVWDCVIKMAICYGVSAILSYLLRVLMIHLSQRIIYTMRRQLFEKLVSLPVRYFDMHSTGDIISRMSYDIDTINASLSQDVVQVMTSVYTVVGSLIFMWRISKPMIVVFFITVPVSILLTRYRAKRVRPLFRARSQMLGALNGYAEEMLSGQNAIRAYGREGAINAQFDRRNKEAMDAYYKADYYGAPMGPTVNFISNFSISLIAILGGILYMYSQSGAVAAGSVFFITLGGVAQFTQYSRKFAGPINEFANILNEFQSAFAAADRVFRVLDEEPEPADAKGAAVLADVRGAVELQDVRFGYTPSREILHGISVAARPGKTIAIVGPTGAGKTTVINLLMRFYDPTAGVIRVDGMENDAITRESLRRAYTMMLQETWLFHGTIYENIVYGRENATREEVYAAAKAAHISHYIEHLPLGYDTVLSDDGTNISKGQRQLITIARAMLANTPMLILDEATSNVDSRTEARIQAAMAELMQGRTCFIIAHRLSTIQNADLILVLKDGAIIERGNHHELMRQGGFYSALYNAQFV